MSIVAFIHTSRPRELARIVRGLWPAKLASVDRRSRASVLVFRGAPGWSIVVADPDDDLIVKRSTKRSAPRLSEIAMALQRSALALEVEGHSPPVCYEATPAGRLFISGGNESRTVHGLRIERRYFRNPRLRRLSLPSIEPGETIDPEEVAAALSPAVPPEILLHATHRLFGRELRPAGSLAPPIASVKRRTQTRA